MAKKETKAEKYARAYAAWTPENDAKNQKQAKADKEKRKAK